MMKFNFYQRKVGITLLALVACFAAPVFASPTYGVIELGSLGTSQSYASGYNSYGEFVTVLVHSSYNVAYGINNIGQVVGKGAGLDGIRETAIFWKGSTPTNLNLGTGDYSQAVSINDSGMVVGTSYNPAHGLSQVTLWQGTSKTYFGSAGHSSFVSGINNSGQIVGENYTPGFQATLWDGAMQTSLPGSGVRNGQSFANDINNFGQIVGRSELPSGGFHATFWNGKSVSYLDDHGFGSNAYGINDLAQIAGVSYNPADGNYHATIWSGSDRTFLGDIGVAGLGTQTAQSIGTKINNKGQVIGAAFDLTAGAYKPTVWIDGVGTDLSNFLPFASEFGGRSMSLWATDINDNGSIVLNATRETLVNGIRVVSRHAYVLTPVPEPSSILLLALGLLWLSFTRRQKF